MSTVNALASTSQIDERREADPLPRKQGELGFVAPADGETDAAQARHNDTANPLPARHPADRDHSTTSEPTNGNQQQQQQPTTASNTTPGTSAKPSLIERLSWQGIHFSSLLRIFLLLVFLGGTGAAWALTIKRFGNDSQNGQNDDVNAPEENQDGNDGQLRIPSAFSSLVFVHVAFTVITLFELLFLERSLYQARAERYMFKHGMARNTTSMASVGLAPWNRPPLPTYAAALAESGIGTGDVEDNLIAIPPPPAYGNTRGSVLLLSSFLQNSLTRTASRNSARQSRSPEAQMEEGRRSRPVSYGQSEEIDDARRAMQLEQSLQKLQERSVEGRNTPSIRNGQSSNT